MVELPLIFAAGILGSAHCLGMCGPFAVAIAAGARGWRENVLRQLLYSAGRVFTYVVLGAAAGYCALRMAQPLRDWVRLPAFLSIVAGVLLLHQGLIAAGLLPRRILGKADGAGCLTASVLGLALRHRAKTGSFVAGLFSGLLPCGLLYGMAATAGSSASVLRGAAIMLAFGAGTIPFMLLAGCGGNLLTVSTRRRIFRLAAWSVVIAGIVAIVRGASYLNGQTACPYCP